MNWIDDLLTDDQSMWHETAKGNWCRKNDSDEVMATVFRNSYGAWQIIINLERLGRLVANEYFTDSTVAQDRAEAILSGANCRFLPPKLVWCSGMQPPVIRYPMNDETLHRST